MGARQDNDRFNWRSSLDLVASVSMIAVAAMLVLNGRAFGTSSPRSEAKVGLPSEPVSLDGLATKGNRRSPVGLIVYSDFQCPFCRRFALEVLPIVERELVTPGFLVVAFKHLPLESIHPHALAAATLAECSNRAGDFWRMHDNLFAEAAISPSSIEALAKRDGIAPDSGCRIDEGAALVRQHQKEADQLGITGTPTFLLGAVEVDGRLSVKRILAGSQSAQAISLAVKGLTGVAR